MQLEIVSHLPESSAAPLYGGICLLDVTPALAMLLLTKPHLGVVTVSWSEPAQTGLGQIPLSILVQGAQADGPLVQRLYTYKISFQLLKVHQDLDA